MKCLLFPALILAAACAAAPPPAAAPPVSDGIREDVEREIREQIGAAALAEAARAPSAILLRRSVSLPRMIRQPDGSFRPERGGAVVALRTSSGWVRIDAAGRRPFDAAASREIDRLLGARELWSEPRLPPATCTDPGGVGLVVRHRGRQRVTAQPCGEAGLTGRLGAIVMAGRVTRWGGTPPEAQPAGIRLERLPDDAIRPYRFSSGLYDARNLVIRDEREWLGQWRRITSGQSGSPPPVDFSREMLLLAAMGTRATGGYSVEVERVIDTGADLEAHVVHRSPGPRCGTTQALTRPLDIVRIPASAKQVRWVVRQAVGDCR